MRLPKNSLSCRLFSVPSRLVLKFVARSPAREYRVRRRGQLADGRVSRRCWPQTCA